MPYDPDKPANGTNASSAEMREQLQSLNAEIQQRATQGALNSHIADNPHNCTSVQTLAEQGISYGDSEKQQLADKLGELITALRRAYALP